MTEDTARLVGLLKSLDVFLAELDVHRADELLEVLERGRAHDRGGHDCRGLSEQAKRRRRGEGGGRTLLGHAPRERDLRHADALLLRELLDAANDLGGSRPGILANQPIAER